MSVGSLSWGRLGMCVVNSAVLRTKSSDHLKSCSVLVTGKDTMMHCLSPSQ